MHWVVSPSFAKRAKLLWEESGLSPKLRHDTSCNKVHLYAQDRQVDSSKTLPDLDHCEYSICDDCELCSSSNESRGARQRNVRYDVYPPLVLVGRNSALSPIYASRLCEMHGCTHVAQNLAVEPGIVRTPHIKSILGDFGAFLSGEPTETDFTSAFWASATQLGVYQTWAPLYTMFSKGNLSEKQRVLQEFGKQRTTTGSYVVDLYCGIGYFTLMYAKAGARLVLGWDINPWSAEGLRRAALKNGFDVRIVRLTESTPILNLGERPVIIVFVEDNCNAIRRIKELNIPNTLSLSHINMGLLPDCRKAWSIAKELSNQSIVHVHENVAVSELAKWREEASTVFGECLQVERIKQYSPKVVHVCGDFACV